MAPSTDEGGGRPIHFGESRPLCTSVLSHQRVTDFAELAGEWDELVNLGPRPLLFMTYRWQTTWWSELREGAELHVLALRETDVRSIGSRGEPTPLVGIAPLFATGETLSLVGGEEVSDYLDLISRPGCANQVACLTADYFAAGPWRTLRLHGVPSSSPTRELLAALARDRGWLWHDEVEDVCPRLELPDSFDAYLASLSKKDRHELRRKLRRLFASGDVKWYAVEPHALQPRDVDDFLQLHRLDVEKASFMTPRMERFFRQILARFQPGGVARLYFLEVDGVRVSTVLLFDYRDEYLLYNSGFDPAYAHLSVGLLLKALTLQEAIERGRRGFDFLQGREPYKYDLGGIDSTVHRLTIQKSA